MDNNQEYVSAQNINYDMHIYEEMYQKKKGSY